MVTKRALKGHSRQIVASMLTAPQDDGLVQEKRNFTANALEMSLSCTNPLKTRTMHNLRLVVFLLLLH